jgi:hypothetical protein
MNAEWIRIDWKKRSCGKDIRNAGNDRKRPAGPMAKRLWATEAATNQHRPLRQPLQV